VKSYTGKYHKFVAMVSLWVCTTSSNAKGSKWVYGYVSSMGLYYNVWWWFL